MNNYCGIVESFEPFKTKVWLLRLPTMHAGPELELVSSCSFKFYGALERGNRWRWSHTKRVLQHFKTKYDSALHYAWGWIEIYTLKTTVAKPYNIVIKFNSFRFLISSSPLKPYVLFHHYQIVHLHDAFALDMSGSRYKKSMVIIDIILMSWQHRILTPSGVYGSSTPSGLLWM